MQPYSGKFTRAKWVFLLLCVAATTNPWISLFLFSFYLVRLHSKSENSQAPPQINGKAGHCGSVRSIDFTNSHSCQTANYSAGLKVSASVRSVLRRAVRANFPFWCVAVRASRFNYVVKNLLCALGFCCISFSACIVRVLFKTWSWGGEK